MVPPDFLLFSPISGTIRIYTEGRGRTAMSGAAAELSKDGQASGSSKGTDGGDQSSQEGCVAQPAGGLPANPGKEACACCGFAPITLYTVKIPAEKKAEVRLCGYCNDIFKMAYRDAFCKRLAERMLRR